MATSDFVDSVNKKFEPPFNDINLLSRALGLPTSGSQGLSTVGRQRLAYVGDAVLLTLVRAEIVIHSIELDKSDLLLSNDFLARQAVNLGLVPNCTSGAIMSPAQVLKHGTCFEAVIGAYYFDRGLGAVKDFLKPFFLQPLVKLIKREIDDPIRQAITMARLQTGRYPEQVFRPGHKHVTCTLTLGPSIFRGHGLTEHAALKSAAKKVIRALLRPVSFVP